MSPTVRRWIPTLSMLLVSLISYIDRNTLALLAPTILKETHLSAEQYGFIISAFSISYMISNPVWGWTLDRIGLRIGMLAAVTIWTAASVSHVFAATFFAFAVARAALGFGEGATFPGGLRTVVTTLDPSRQSRGLAVAYSGGSLGAIVTPIIVTPIALWYGWRAGFWFTGFVGLAWITLWLFVSRRPELRARATAGETDSKPRPRFTDRRTWAFLGAYALGGFPIGFILYNTSLYLSRAWNASQADIGKVLWIPPLGWELGYFFWGWLSDRRLRDSKDPMLTMRNLFLIATVMSLPLALNPYLPSFGLVLFELFYSMFVCGAWMLLPLAYATRVFSKSDSALISGLTAGAWSAVVAVVMPIFGRLFDQRHFSLAFTIAALIPVAGYAVWHWGHFTSKASGLTSAVGATPAS